MPIEYIRNEEENSKTKFISYKGDTIRFDIAIISSPSLHPNHIVVDMNSNKYTSLSLSNIDKNNYIEHALQYNEIEAEDFRHFIRSHLS
ncbi:MULTISPECIES: SAV0927 family protein [Gracilibacillus]|uniref:SAV0927 family protein n=1 Tax=Gracilibacillus TaxID=74385 RepID=UPI000AFEDC5C|nr:SAV0927 family protein [Gracilibacillus dipsosauri]